MAPGRWARKYDQDAATDGFSPLPTQVIGNEEYGSIWWGSPQWQIEAFRRFTMPAPLITRLGYAPLTPEVKARILGLNAAGLYGIDPNARRAPVPPDFISKLKAAYLEEGPAPSLTQYGWVHAGRSAVRRVVRQR